jgi:uracil-DNA glycosylase
MRAGVTATTAVCSTSMFSRIARRSARALASRGRWARRNPNARAFAHFSNEPASNATQAASPRVERALAALKFELDNGCVDVRGKSSLFSEFAREELTRMGEELSTADDSRGTFWNERCRSAFERYDELSVSDRMKIVNTARDVLDGTLVVREPAATVEASEEPRREKSGKQSLIEGDAWKRALEEGRARRLEIETVMRNNDASAQSEEQQGSGAWFQLRASRLTASAFGNAIGFWREGRNELWEEKLGLREGFSGNDATEWGSSKEDEAVAVYEAFAGRKVSHLLFHLLSSDDAELWIGASPDGLIGTNAADGDGEMGGVLEIKCPFNKGSPLTAQPYAKVPWYYIPQVQGLMAIFDRPWCDLVSYTVNGGVAIYRVERDHEYWSIMYSCLSDFWWQSLVPAKHALAAGKDVERYRPAAEHPLCAELKKRSKDIANASKTTWIAPDQVAELRDIARAR